MNEAQAAIQRIMSRINTVGNDIEIRGEKVNYNAVSEKAVLNLVRPLFVEEGLIYYPIDGQLQVSGSVTFISATLRIVHVESGDFFDIWAAGAGKDSQDKGPGKATTYTTKYGLLKVLMLRGEDDPDNTGSEEITKREKELDLLQNKAKEVAERCFNNKKLGKAEYNHVLANIVEVRNSTDAKNRLNAAIKWCTEIEEGTKTFTLEDQG